jgi:hypothetical protein
MNLTALPLTGRKGNREFLMHCTGGVLGTAIDEEQIQKEVLQFYDRGRLDK